MIVGNKDVKQSLHLFYDFLKKAERAVGVRSYIRASNKRLTKRIVIGRMTAEKVLIERKTGCVSVHNDNGSARQLAELS